MVLSHALHKGFVKLGPAKGLCPAHGLGPAKGLKRGEPQRKHGLWWCKKRRAAACSTVTGCCNTLVSNSNMAR